MAKRSPSHKPSQQTPSTPPEELESPLADEMSEDKYDEGDLLDDLFTDTPSVTEQVQLAPEPLFSALLKRTLTVTCPDDRVLHDYAQFVVPHLSDELAHHTAKGGDFAVQHREEKRGRAADYSADQSLRAHLINGLLPAAQVARTLLRWEVPRFEDDWDETTYRLFCAGYTLHDWTKLPSVKTELATAGLDHSVSVVPNLPLVEEIFQHCCVQLGIDQFLEPIGGADHFLHDLIFIASNTQRLWGTMRNLSALQRLRCSGRSRELATDVSTLADLLAYVGRTPVEAATHRTIKEHVSITLGNGQAELTYHHVAEVRGVLTNIINNAAMEAYAIADVREPLLYAPTGVVYLAKKDAPPAPAVADVATATIERVKELCRAKLQQDLIGFERGGKGIKYADYYDLFFSPRQFVYLVPRATERLITKNVVAGKRYASIGAKNMATPGIDLALPDYREVDRLAEGCALLAKVAAPHAPDFDAEGWMLQQLGVEELRDEVQKINSNRTAGGVPYGWYYAAGVCRQRTPGRDEQEWVEHFEQIAQGVAAHLPDNVADGWGELQQYITDHLHFMGSNNAHDLVARVSQELANYSKARKSGRGATNVCSLCSLPYGVDVQQEAAILFAPQVYTNKQPLHSSKAIRRICAVCRMEMMLRQLLMKRGRESGKNFEGRKVRYLFFYPSYFFTTETLGMFRDLQTELRQISFTNLRKLLLNEMPDGALTADLSFKTFQRIQDLLLDPSVHSDPSKDRMFRLHYREREPITFYFLGIPPAGRDATETEAWVRPAFLALVLPVLVDVKVVASESMIPLFNEATELPETVAFDGAHAFVRYLTGSSHLNLLNLDEADQAVQRLNLDEVGRALQSLTAAYLVHLDGNARTGAGGYDYRWSEMSALARNLATSPLYAFHYLKKAQRRENQDSPGMPKAALYLDLFTYLAPKGDDENMSHARNLTEIYRRFYRAERLNSNAILRPVSEAAKTILTADLQFFDTDEALEEAVYGKLCSFLENVMRGSADGRLPKGSTYESRDAALREFSHYMVHEVYRKAFNGDRSALRGKQLNLLKNTCEALYLDEQRKERAERQEDDEEEAAEPPVEAS